MINLKSNFLALFLILILAILASAQEVFKNKDVCIVGMAFAQWPAMGKVEYKFNSPGWLYEDYFFQELIPYMEANYRIVADKEHRAIAGLSMGGGGTIVYASHHPELFCAAYAMSAYLYRQNLPWLNQADPVREKMQKLVEDNSCQTFKLSCDQRNRIPKTTLKNSIR